MEIQREAYALIPKDAISNTTIAYYRSQRERVDKKIDDFNSDIDSKIAALEMRRRSTVEKLESEKKTYEMEILTRTQKLEDPEPQTQSYRKLVADLAKLQEEKKAAQQDVKEKSLQLQIINDRHTKSLQKQAIEKLQQKEREQQQKDDAERERIERINTYK